MNMNIFLGLILPLIGTSAGAACVFVMRRQMNALVQKALLGFASGVMVAASVWSLLDPGHGDVFWRWAGSLFFRLSAA